MTCVAVTAVLEYLFSYAVNQASGNGTIPCFPTELYRFCG